MLIHTCSFCVLQGSLCSWLCLHCVHVFVLSLADQLKVLSATTSNNPVLVISLCYIYYAWWKQNSVLLTLLYAVSPFILKLFEGWTRFYLDNLSSFLFLCFSVTFSAWLYLIGYSVFRWPFLWFLWFQTLLLQAFSHCCAVLSNRMKKWAIIVER